MAMTVALRLLLADAIASATGGEKMNVLLILVSNPFKAEGHCARSPADAAVITCEFRVAFLSRAYKTPA